MIIATLMFYLFSAVIIGSAFMVITVKNPVHSVLFLILAFFNAGGLFVLLGAELLAMILVIVYVGAVAVLFLFVVMMLNINYAKLKESVFAYRGFGIAIAIALFMELMIIISLSESFISPLKQPNATPGKTTNAEAIGNVLYTDYVYAFQLAGLVLLVAMIGAIVLTHREREGVRKQNISEQLARDPKDAIELVNIETGSGA